jgi:hypothetical protein
MPKMIMIIIIKGNINSFEVKIIWHAVYMKLDYVRSQLLSVVSDYKLDNRAIEVRSPAEAKYFSCSLCVQTGSGAHPASCTMGTGGPFPGGKARPGRDADHSPSSNVENE